LRLCVEKIDRHSGRGLARMALAVILAKAIHAFAAPQQRVDLNCPLS
jgi:hypothetical protein